MENMSTIEKVPQTPVRRTTRVSASSSSRIPSTVTKLSDRNLPHFAESYLTLQDLLYSLPGRNAQIVELLQLIGPTHSPMLPIFIYGSTSTGKTSTILQIFRHLNRPLVYISCRSCYSPRILFESILNQLLCHRKSEGNGYSSAKKCEKASEFVNLLKDAILKVLGELNDPKKIGDIKMVYFVFDNVESIKNWDKNGAVLSLLFKIGDILRINEIGFIYVSSLSPDGYYLSSGSIEPVNVYFPDYKVEDLHAILMRNQPYPKLYFAFLSAVLKPFYRITRRVDELSIALEPLFKIYCDPLDDLKVIPDEAMKRRLFDNIQPHLVVALNETFKVPAWSSNESSNVDAGTKKWHTRKLREEICKELEFHMSTSAKYLLLSAFLASRNPATLDASLFDSTGGFDNRKRGRNSKTSNDKKELTAQETFMKGPGSFPLERLLAIFQCITSVDDSYESECTEEEGTSRNEKIGLMSDVLLQLSTLCNANFLCKSGSCQLDVSTRYRSTIDEELALKVARSIHFPLSKYMYR